MTPLAPCCWQTALTQSAGTFTAGFGAKYSHWTDKPWLMSAWLGSLELNEVTINHYSGWFLTLRSSLQKRKSHYLSLADNVFFPMQSLPYLHPMLAARNSCLSFSDTFLARSFPPHGVWQDYEVPKPQASFCFEAWKWSFSLIILSLPALPLLQPSWMLSSPVPKHSHGNRTPAHGYRQWQQLTSCEDTTVSQLSSWMG